MKIQTKYSVGQQAWTRGLQQPVQVTVNSIQVEAREQKEFTVALIIYELDHNGVLFYRCEEDIFDSQKAATRAEEPQTIHVIPGLSEPMNP